MMPRFDGYEVLRAPAGRRPHSAEVPVLVLTADGRIGRAIARATSSGADAVITKPFMPESLTDGVARSDRDEPRGPACRARRSAERSREDDRSAERRIGRSTRPGEPRRNPRRAPRRSGRRRRRRLTARAPCSGARRRRRRPSGNVSRGWRALDLFCAVSSPARKYTVVSETGLFCEIAGARVHLVALALEELLAPGRRAPSRWCRSAPAPRRPRSAARVVAGRGLRSAWTRRSARASRSGVVSTARAARGGRRAAVAEAVHHHRDAADDERDEHGEPSGTEIHAGPSYPRAWHRPPARSASDPLQRGSPSCRATRRCRRASRTRWSRRTSIGSYASAAGSSMRAVEQLVVAGRREAEALADRSLLGHLELPALTLEIEQRRGSASSRHMGVVASTVGSVPTGTDGASTSGGSAEAAVQKASIEADDESTTPRRC